MDRSAAAMIMVLSLAVMMVFTVEAKFRECSVNISNHIVTQLPTDPGPDTLTIDCMKGKKHRHIFTPQLLPTGEHYYGWKFVPDVWGETRYDCDFTWPPFFRRIRVWEDENLLVSATRVRFCRHCVWHATREGFWRMTSDRGEPLPVWSGGWCNMGQLTCVG